MPYLPPRSRPDTHVASWKSSISAAAFSVSLRRIVGQCAKSSYRSVASSDARSWPMSSNTLLTWGKSLIEQVLFIMFATLARTSAADPSLNSLSAPDSSLNQKGFSSLGCLSSPPQHRMRSNVVEMGEALQSPTL